MAEDITIRANLDISGIKQSLREVQRLQEQTLAKAKDGASRVPRMTKDLESQLGSPQSVKGADVKNIQEAIKVQAQLTALKLQQLEVEKRIAHQGRVKGFTDRQYNQTFSQVGSAATSGLTNFLGRDLKPQELALFTDTVNSVFRGMRTQLENIHYSDLTDKFLDVARPISTPLAVTSKSGGLVAQNIDTARNMAHVVEEPKGGAKDLDAAQAAAAKSARDFEVSVNRAINSLKKLGALSVGGGSGGSGGGRRGGAGAGDDDGSGDDRFDNFGTAKDALGRFIDAVEQTTSGLAMGTDQFRQSMAEFMAAEEAVIARIKNLANKITLENPEMISARADAAATGRVLTSTINAEAVKKINADPDLAEREAVAKAELALGNKKLKNAEEALKILNVETAGLTREEMILKLTNDIAKMEEVVKNKDILTKRQRLAVLKAIAGSQLTTEDMMGIKDAREAMIKGGVGNMVGGAQLGAGIRGNLLDSPKQLERYIDSAASDKVYKKRIDNLIEEELLLSKEYAAATSEAQLIDLEKRANALDLAAQKEGLAAAQLRLARAQAEARASKAQAILGDPNVISSRASADSAQAQLKTRTRIEQLERLLSDPEAVEYRRRERELQREYSAIGAVPKNQDGVAKRARSAFSNPAEFLGGGMLTTMRYALPSAAMWGAYGVISEGVADAEEFNLVLSQLEIQFQETGEGGAEAFRHAREEIVEISKSTGLLAAEVAEMRRHIQGAFSGMNEIDIDDPTGSQGGLMGSDGIIRYGQELIDMQSEAAAKLVLVTGLTTTEVTDGLTAASMAFGASADRIGDVAVKLEAVGGTKASDLISFIGDIGPSARQAGFELEELMSIANAALKNSGMNGAAIAEQMGRIMAAMTGNSSQFFDIADANRSRLGEESYKELVASIAGGDTRSVFMTLGKYYNDLDKASRDVLVNIIGGQRQANTLLAAFADASSIDSMIESASDSYGALDRRFENMQQKISMIFKRLKAEFNEFTRLLMDAGIADAVGSIAENFVMILDVISKLAQPIVMLNDALGGALSAVSGLVIQMGLLHATLMAMSRIRQGEMMVGLLGPTGGPRQGAGARVQGLGNRLSSMYQNSAFAAGYTRSLQGSRAAVGVRSTLPPFSAPAGFQAPNSFIRSRTSGMAGLRMQAGAGLAGLGAALGPVGIGFLGLTALTTVSGIISDKVDKDKQELAELNVSLRNDQRSIDELRTEAEALNTHTGAFGEIYRNVFSIASEKAIYELEIARREVQASIDRLYAATSGWDFEHDGDPFMDLIKGDLDTSPESYDKGWFGDLTDMLMNLSDVTSSAQYAGAGVSSGEARDDARQILKNLNFDPKSDVAKEFLDFQEGMRALLYSTTTEQMMMELDSIANSIGSDNPELAKFLVEMRGAIARAAGENPETASILANAQEELNAFVKAEGEAIGGAFETIQASFRSRKLSRDQYVSNVENKIANLRARQASGAGLTKEELKALNDLPKELAADLRERANQTLETYQVIDSINGSGDLRAAAQKVRDAMGSRGSSASSISSILNLSDTRGTDERLNSMASSLNLLQQNGFEDTSLATEVAIEWIENAKEFRDQLASEISTADKGMNDLFNQGIDIPTPVRSALQVGILKDTDEWIKASAGWAAALEVYNTQVGLIEENLKLPKDQQQKLEFGFIDAMEEAGIDMEIPVDQMLAKLIEEMNSGNGVSDATINKMLEQYIALDNIPTDDLTENDVKNIESVMQTLQMLLLMVIGNGDLSADAMKARAKMMSDGTIYQWMSGNGIALPTVPDTIVPDRESDKTRNKNALDLRLANIDKMRALANGNAQQIAQLDRAAAQAELAYAEANLAGHELDMARTRAQTSIIKANQAEKDALIADRRGRFELMRALAEDAGDIVGVARAGLAEAQDQLANAKTSGERDSARAAIIMANKAIREAQQEERNAQADYMRTVVTRDDPLAQAQWDLGMANILLSEARGVAARAEAAKRVVEAQREVAAQMFDIQMSIFELREAQLQAIDDEVGAAWISAEMARAQLSDAISRGAGQAEINRLQAGVISADKAARDTVFNEQLEEYQWLLDTGKITKGQYIQYLEGLKSTLQPGTKQFKDLERTLYQLRNDIGNDLQFNLPTSLALPTMYVARRLDQTQAAGSAGGSPIGYQDNRTMDVQVIIGQNMTEDQIVRVMSDALGVGRNALTVPKRF